MKTALSEVKTIAFEYEKAGTSHTKKLRMLELLDELQIPYKSSNDYVHIQVRDFQKVKIDIWPTTKKICLKVKTRVDNFTEAWNEYYYNGAKQITNELINFKKNYKDYL
jgi:hypothetical protein